MVPLRAVGYRSQYNRDHKPTERLSCCMEYVGHIAKMNSLCDLLGKFTLLLHDNVTVFSPELTSSCKAEGWKRLGYARLAYTLAPVYNIANTCHSTT